MYVFLGNSCICIYMCMRDACVGVCVYICIYICISPILRKQLKRISPILRKQLKRHNAIEGVG